MKISVIGLGKLGLPLASLFSQSGYDVLGYDLPDRIKQLKSNNFINFEPNCDYSKVELTDSLHQVLLDTEVGFVCVNTPSTENRKMDLSQVYSVMGDAKNILRIAKVGYTFVINSTVMPGTSRRLNNYFHQSLSDGWPVNVISNPVWIAMGSVIKDLSNPPVILIGDDSYDKNNQHNPPMWLANIWRDCTSRQNLYKVLFTDTTTAEFAKLAHNAWCTIKMSFMGYIGDQQQRLDIDINDLTKFFENGGERAGKFWKYGPSFGGPCFPRDLDFFNQVISHPISQSSKMINSTRIAQAIGSIKPESRVLILGGYYKYGVPVYTDSLGVQLKERLVNDRLCEVELYDDDINNSHQPQSLNTDKYDYVIIAHKEYESNFSSVSGSLKVLNLWS